MTNLDFSPLINQLSSQINGETVLTVMGAVVGSTVGIFLIVWGGRLLIDSLQVVLTNGKIMKDPWDSGSYMVFDSNGFYKKQIYLKPKFRKKVKQDSKYDPFDVY